MPARLTAYLPDYAAASRLLRPPQRVIVGRGGDCDFPLDHPSISRRHAEIWRDGSSWRVIDLGSKNGTFISGTRIGSVRLEDSGWLRIGDVQCEFQTLTPEAADNIEQRQAVRRANSLLFAERLATRTRLTDLLLETVRAAVELSECERGFLLLGQPGALEVAARHAIEPEALHGREFGGSVGAVERALLTGAPLVVNDVTLDAALSGRASVVASGLRSLVCMPLALEGERLGLLYADSRNAGAPITALDLELLVAFLDRAAMWIVARRGAAALDGMLADGGLAPPRQSWSEVLSARQAVA